MSSTNRQRIPKKVSSKKVHIKCPLVGQRSGWKQKIRNEATQMKRTRQELRTCGKTDRLECQMSIHLEKKQKNKTWKTDCTLRDFTFSQHLPDDGGSMHL
jgi:hypothetical protein